MDTPSFTSHHKIVTRERLTEIVQTLNGQGKTIVSTNGSFDLLHLGHVMMLKEAKSLGDVLIVGLNTDASVQRYKGRFRPICPQQHRAEMLAALTCTDYICLFDESTPIELLEVIRPHIHVNSPEHGAECVEREVVERHGGRIHLAQLLAGLSTSRLIERIVETASHTPCRGLFIRPDVLMVSDASDDVLVNMLCHLSSQEGFQLIFLSSDVEETDERNIVETLRQQGIVIIHASSIERVVEEYDVVLARSWFVSNQMADIRTGRELNCKTILVAGGMRGQTAIPNTGSAPHAIVRDLKEIATNLSSGL